MLKDEGTLSAVFWDQYALSFSFFMAVLADWYDVLDAAFLYDILDPGHGKGRVNRSESFGFKYLNNSDVWFTNTSSQFDSIRPHWFHSSFEN